MQRCPPSRLDSTVFQSLSQQLHEAVNEEEVRLAWVRALESALPIIFKAERGRRDLSYNNVAIEFKGPGKFRDGAGGAAFREAIEKRLVPYIKSASENEGVPERDYIGLAIDNTHLAFVQVGYPTVRHSGLLPITELTFEMVVEACNASYRRPITASNLIEDFGHESIRGTDLMKALAEALSYAKSRNDGAKVQMLFEEWRTLYGQVADLSREQLRSINGTLRFARAHHTSEVPERLFVVHTYNCLLAKLLAAQIVAAHGLASGREFATDLIAVRDDSQFLARLRSDIECGGFFDAVGIRGFVEEVIFSWYLDVAEHQEHRSALCGAIRSVLAGIVLYRTDELRHVRDVLRDFYQDLVPDLLRRALGEFYTPEWLVEFTMNRASTSDWFEARVLDPTCGSGSFLVGTIRRKRDEAARRGIGPADTLNMLMDSVWGFDLNPMAVQVARTNFLMAIADLLAATPGHEVELPVLLADAVYSPAQMPGSEAEEIRYQIGSEVSNLVIVLPAQLAFDRSILDSVFSVMGELVDCEAPYEECEAALLERSIVSAAQMSSWTPLLRETYEQVLGLHRRNWNGIWFRIVRNFFWSATAGDFDLIIGNPPWVRWSKLPPAYRERAKPTCSQYNIFSDTPHHGGNELDISGMITYTTADKWLKTGGTLAFVITQTHFQSPSSQGFRRFYLSRTNEHLAPTSVDDLQHVKAFPRATNKPSVAVFRKTPHPPTYPIPYCVWKARRGQSAAIPPSLALGDVLNARIASEALEAQPVAEGGSPWSILAPGRFAVVSLISGRSTWVHGRKGITTDLNGIFFVLIEDHNEQRGLVRVRTRPQAGRANVGPARSFWVEPDLLYPLLKGAGDFDSCQVEPKERLFVFVPNEGITQGDLARGERRLNSDCSRTKRYFGTYRAALERRSTLKTRMMNAPFYSIYNVGSYTFAPFKVVWAEQSRRFKAAVVSSGHVPVIGSRPYVPDHKLFFVDFSEAEPAYYLCGLLMSSVVREFVESHNISIQVGNIFKHMSLPRFDAEVSKHRELADLTRSLHGVSGDTEREERAGQVERIADEVVLRG